MKKGLVFVVAIVVILTFVLAGCNLIVTNEERDGDQVVATVEHNGLIGEITKKEFSNYFLSNIQQLFPVVCWRGWGVFYFFACKTKNVDYSCHWKIDRRQSWQG